MKKLFLACDHAAYEAKEFLKTALELEYKNELELVDLGTHSSESVHYPEFGQKIAQEVLASDALGIALCGSGIGISIAVNRFKGIRGALCCDVEDARLARQHNNSNILCLGARKRSHQELLEMARVWLSTSFEGGRHQTRVELLDR